MFRTVCRFLALSVLSLGLLSLSELQAADKAQVQQAIAKGAAHCRTLLEKASSSRKSLIYLTLLKAGEPHDGPLMKAGVAHAKSKFKGGVYDNPSSHLYEAGVDAIFLADLDPEAYLPELQAIASYILQHQESHGGWGYPPPHKDPNCIKGDISSTHYACLGLWAASRAGIKIDPQVWVRVLTWLQGVQNSDGGYNYWPGTKIGGDQNGGSTPNMTVNSVGTMYICMLNLEPDRVPLMERPTAAKPVAKEASKPDAKQSVIEAVNLDNNTDPNSANAQGTGTIPPGAFGSADKAYRWIVPRFDVVNKVEGFKSYYYYSLERMCALANTSKIGDRDWFNECADVLIKNQLPDGSWSFSTIGDKENDTCFCVLFLTRSTGKLLKRVTPEATVGGGLLSGGRGLPDDLGNVDAKGNVKRTKEKSSLDELLASLADPDSLDVGDAQSELVEQIQLGDKTQLIGKKDLLVKLVASPKADVRQTAIWAIGRSGNLSMARYAVAALDDPDSAVMVEAHRALCWTARKPKAFKLPDDPLDGLPPDAGPDQKTAAVDAWRRQAVRLWGEWYLRNRPYAERGDEFETTLRNRLLQLQ